MKQVQLKLAFALTGFLLFFSGLAVGQRQISGKVTDADTGEGLIGASVSVKGTTIGVATDMRAVTASVCRRMQRSQGQLHWLWRPGGRSGR